MTAAYWLGYVAGFACGAIGMHFLMEVIRNRRKPAAPVMQTATMQAPHFGITACTDPDCPFCRDSACNDPVCPFCRDSGAGQFPHLILPDKDTKH